MSKRVGKTELVRSLATKQGISLKEAKVQVDLVFEEIEKQLVAGNTLTIKDMFSLEPITRGEHYATNPQTGNQVFVPVKTRIRLRIGTKLKLAMNPHL